MTRVNFARENEDIKSFQTSHIILSIYLLSTHLYLLVVFWVSSRIRRFTKTGLDLRRAEEI